MVLGRNCGPCLGLPPSSSGSRACAITADMCGSLGGHAVELQRPAKQARERNKEARRQWVAERCAASKKNAGVGKAWIIFQDESGISERPPVRRTWAPKGETPVLIHAFNWKKLSICAALGYRWDGQRCRCGFKLGRAATTTRA